MGELRATDSDEAMDSDEEMPTFVLVSVLRCVGRTLTYAAEMMASRPRGQQFLRQVDRMLDMVERLARSLSHAISFVLRPFVRNADEGRENHWSYSTMRLRHAIPLVVVVLPAFMTTLLVLMLPTLTIILPVMIAGSFANTLFDRIHDSVRDVLPTPANVAALLRRWRRRLRSIRFEGMRRMRDGGHGYHDTNAPGTSAIEVRNNNSLFLRLFVWWPVTGLALIGQFIGLGRFWSPKNVSSGRGKRALENMERASSEEEDDAETSLKRKSRDSEDEDFKHAAIQSTTQILELLPDGEHSSDEYYTTDEEDMPTLGGPVGELAHETSKNESQTSQLAMLMSDELLPSDDEIEDPSYVPDANEETDEDEDDGNSDDEEGKREEYANKESKDVIDEDRRNKTENYEEDKLNENLETDNEKTLTPGSAANLTNVEK